MDKNTAVIDSPESLGAALCRHLPDMASGFTITTRENQLQMTVSAEDTSPFMVAMERLLQGKINQIQRGHQAGVSVSELAQSNRHGEKLTADEIVKKYCQSQPYQQLSSRQGCEDRDYATRHMSLEDLNTILDRALEQGMPEQMLAPFRNGVKTREQARKLELSFYAWSAIENIRYFHHQRSHRACQQETPVVSGQDAGCPCCNQQGHVQPEAGGQEQNDSPCQSDTGRGTRRNPGDQTNCL
ncbi:hypothetical protein [Escherichia coli]|uniref:hypothetical protein n=1 Tax=Escherichia coli TaxID=562 RepID=UPI002A35A368|nr:hypothetical protein [Escherichia coli]